MTDIQDDLTLAVLLAEVRPPDYDGSYFVWTSRPSSRKLEWHGTRRIIIEFNADQWAIADSDNPRWRVIAFPELLALFQNPEYRKRWGLNPP